MADGTFPESIGFIMFVDPVEEPKVFGEKMRCLEGDWAINPSVSFNPTNRALYEVNALRLASICGPRWSELPSKHHLISAFMNVILIWQPRLAIMHFRDKFLLVRLHFKGHTRGSSLRYLSLWVWSLLQWHQLELGLGLSRELHPGRVWDPPSGVHASDGALQEPHL